MKFLLLVAAAVGVLSLSANASRVSPRLPVKCFTSEISCCFKFAPCGFVQKKIPVSYRCDFKVCGDKCRRVCKKVCQNVKVKVPKRVCHPVFKRACYWYKNKLRIWVYGCKWVPTLKKKCKIIVVTVTKRICRPVCKKVCVRVCKTVKATCHKVNTVKFQKYCPKLSCSKPVFTKGDNKKPKDIVSKRAIFISATKPIRKIIAPKKY